MNLPPPTPDQPLAIRSTLLRSVLLVELDAAEGREVTIAQLCTALARRGFTVRGRPSKVVSDALRVELTKGRAWRTGRGRYRVGTLPRTTRWRCHQRVREAAAGRVAAIHLARPTRARPLAAVRESFEHAERRSRRRVVARRRNATPGEGALPRPTPTDGPAAPGTLGGGGIRHPFPSTTDPPS